jgi:hypothetical protein
MTQKPGIRKTPITTLVPHPSNPRQGDPGYCDVIVQRWEDHTGQTAIRP